MVSVSYQVVFNGKYDFKEEIKELLKSAFEQNYDNFSEEELDSYIEINYEKQIDDDKYIIGFGINFDEIGTEVTKIIKDFSENLKDSEEIILVLKFYDSDLLNFLSDIYKELFKIEMKLREIISLIFIDTYKSGDHLLKDISLKPRFGGKNNLQKDENQRKEYLNKRYENEFFYILFSDYARLTEVRDLKHDDLYFITEVSSNFEEFKENILNRGIKEESYLAFLNNIKPVLSEKIENIRNCIAHNRMLDTNDLENYEKYFEEINKQIDNFLNNLK